MQQARSTRARRWIVVPLSLAVAVSLSLAVTGLASAAEPASPEAVASRPPAPGELALETRLLAPCCYHGTLDAHESDAAQALRMRIRARLYAGEAPDAIEASLVEQYGERIRASSPRDPLRFVAAAVVAGAALAGLGLWRVVRRWRRSAMQGGPVLAVAARPAPDPYDRRLDDELAELE
jgi:cytochrome c-type biogenesis protein CcmH